MIFIYFIYFNDELFIFIFLQLMATIFISYSQTRGVPEQNLNALNIETLRRELSLSKSKCEFVRCQRSKVEVAAPILMPECNPVLATIGDIGVRYSSYEWVVVSSQLDSVPAQVPTGLQVQKWNILSSSPTFGCKIQAH